MSYVALDRLRILCYYVNVRVDTEKHRKDGTSRFFSQSLFLNKIVICRHLSLTFAGIEFMSNVKKSVKTPAGTPQTRDSNPRSYWWHSILYPDNQAHVACLSNYLNSPDGDYLYVLHDADGEETKPHWHLVQKFSNPRYRNGVAKTLGIERNLVRVAEYGQNELLYLIHADPASVAAGKHRYDTSEADGTLSDLLAKLLAKQADSVSEEDAIPLMLDYIANYAGYLSLSGFSSWVAAQHFWSFYRRSSLIFVRLIDEHNSCFTRLSPLSAKKTVDMNLCRSIQNSDASTSSSEKEICDVV